MIFRGVIWIVTRVFPKRYTNNAGEECVEECDAVVVTLPLGVLKTDTVTFTPELPERKKSSIERMGFGLLNKVGRKQRSLPADVCNV